jgi:8-oxo-dGTP diphosphatase
MQARSRRSKEAEAAWMENFEREGRQRLRLPLLAVDVALFAFIDQRLCLLLATRQEQPQAGLRALPGVLFDPAREETTEESARRALTAKGGARAPYLEQLKTFSGRRSKDGEPRDPRGAVSTAYLGLAPAEHLELGEHAEWVPVEALEDMELAFDHNDIAREALARLRGKVSYSMLPARALGDTFSLPQLQKAYELILGEALDKSAFRKKMLESGFIEEAPGRLEQAGAGRPSSLWRIKEAHRPAQTFRRNFLG